MNQFLTADRSRTVQEYIFEQTLIKVCSPHLYAPFVPKLVNYSKFKFEICLKIDKLPIEGKCR